MDPSKNWKYLKQGISMILNGKIFENLVGQPNDDVRRLPLTGM